MCRIGDSDGNISGICVLLASRKAHYLTVGHFMLTVVALSVVKSLNNQ